LQLLPALGAGFAIVEVSPNVIARFNRAIQ
jgi:hypothetical protein